MPKIRHQLSSVLKITFLALLPAFAAFQGVFPQNLSIKPTTVAGFINRGASGGDQVNAVITKSMIAFLMKIPGAVITPYEEVEKEAAKKGFWARRKLDIDTATSIAQRFESKQMIVGDYLVDDSAETVEINVYVYDVVTGDLKLKRTYQGSSGADIFDTIDRMIKNVSGLLFGRELSFGTVSIEIVNSETKYWLFENGRRLRQISAREGYSDQYIAGMPVDFVLKTPDQKTELLLRTVTPEANRVSRIQYTPAGTLIVSVSGAKSQLVLDGKKAGWVQEGEILTIRDVSADKPHRLSVTRGGKASGEREISVKDGETRLVMFDSSTERAKAQETPRPSATPAPTPSPVRQDKKPPETRVVQSSAKKPETPARRQLYFPIGLLEGGLGGEAGLEWRFTEDFRVSLLAGAVYMGGTVLPEAEASLSYSFLNMGGFKFWVTAGCFSYFTTPLIVSPVLKLECSWGLFYVDGGVRYGVDKNTFYPMLSFGVRL